MRLVHTIVLYVCLLTLVFAADPPSAPSLDKDTKLDIRNLQMDLNTQQATMRTYENQCMVLVNRQPEYTQAALKASEIQTHLSEVIAKATPKGYVLNPATLVLMPLAQTQPQATTTAVVH